MSAESAELSFITPRTTRLGEKPACLIAGWTLGRKDISFASVLKNSLTQHYKYSPSSLKKFVVLQAVAGW